MEDNGGWRLGNKTIALSPGLGSPRFGLRRGGLGCGFCALLSLCRFVCPTVNLRAELLAPCSLFFFFFSSLFFSTKNPPLNTVRDQPCLHSSTPPPLASQNSSQ